MNMLKKFWIIIISQSKFLLLITFIPLPSWALFEEVFSAKNDIFVNDSISLKINSPFPKGCFDETGLVSRKDCFPQNSLWLIKNGKKSDFSQLMRYWTDVFVYFVKISREGYFKDLDKDGNLEFAFYPMVAGNNPITDAYIYSVNGSDLTFYGTGQFHYERGPYVKNIVKGKWVKPVP